MKNFKIGIVTLYHKNTNYGGNLQAYALQKAIEKKGYNVEFINYVNDNRISYIIKNCYEKVVKLLFQNLFRVSSYKAIRYIRKREKALLIFNRQLSHSKVFFKGSINEINEEYDCFITGSDQVWNTRWINDFYTLSFVENKYKFSYAASISKAEFEDNEKEYFRTFLSNYSAVSVREKGAVDLLQSLSPVPVVFSLDPTLLLNKDDWDSICAQRVCDDKYIFCYFLSDDEKMRNVAQTYADKKGYKLISIPYLSNTYRKIDNNYGQLLKSTVSPNVFLSLIKYSESVFTDSFHATVFSHIYHKNYFTFDKGGKSGVRIKSLTSLLDTTDHYLDEYEMFTYDYLNQILPIDYSSPFQKFNEEKEKSIAYLEDNLSIAFQAIL